MAETIIHVGTPGLAGVNPQWAYMQTDQDFATITEPGFLNKVANSGINLTRTTFLLAAYGDPVQVQQFQVLIDDGVFTLQTYSPNDNSFLFTNVQFVAKGGSDLNSGTTLGAPKLTIQAAMNALPITSSLTLVWVLDSGSYSENITMPKNCSLFAPNAIITSTSGDTVTLDDLGMLYSNFIKCNQLGANSGNAIVVNGSLSNLVLDCDIFFGGDIEVEGGLSFWSNVLVNSEIHIASTGVFSPQILFTQGIVTTFDVGSTVNGILGSDQYGEKNFIDKITFQQDELQETIGRTLAVGDSNSTIQYNSVSDGSYVLPQTSDVAIKVGAVVTFAELGTGRILFAQGTGVTIISLFGPAPRTTGAGAKAFAEKLTNTVWLVSGDIEISP